MSGITVVSDPGVDDAVALALLDVLETKRQKLLIATFGGVQAQRCHSAEKLSIRGPTTFTARTDCGAFGRPSPPRRPSGAAVRQTAG